MAISDEELFEIVKSLPEKAKKSAYDYLKFLYYNHSRPDWNEIIGLTPEDIPLSKEEERQLRDNSEFVPWEEIKVELDLQNNSKPRID